MAGANAVLVERLNSSGRLTQRLERGFCPPTARGG